MSGTLYISRIHGIADSADSTSNVLNAAQSNITSLPNVTALGTSTNPLTLGNSGTTTTFNGGISVGTDANITGDLSVVNITLSGEVIGGNLVTSNYVNNLGYATSSSVSSTYAPKASPALTGTPTAPTATAGDNTTQIATSYF